MMGLSKQTLPSIAPGLGLGLRPALALGGIRLAQSRSQKFPGPGRDPPCARQVAEISSLRPRPALRETGCRDVQAQAVTRLARGRSQRFPGPGRDQPCARQVAEISRPRPGSRSGSRSGFLDPDMYPGPGRDPKWIWIQIRVPVRIRIQASRAPAQACLSPRRAQAQAGPGFKPGLGPSRAWAGKSQRPALRKAGHGLGREISATCLAQGGSRPGPGNLCDLPRAKRVAAWAGKSLRPASRKAGRGLGREISATCLAQGGSRPVPGNLCELPRARRVAARVWIRSLDPESGSRCWFRICFPFPNVVFAIVAQKRDGELAGTSLPTEFCRGSFWMGLEESVPSENMFFCSEDICPGMHCLD